MHFLFSIILMLSSPSFADTGYPKIFIEYGLPFDMSCNEADPNKSIKEEMQNELVSRLPEFQKAWDDEGQLLLQATIEIVGKTFSRKEETATLTICHLMPPMSSPLIIRAAWYLKTVTPEPMGLWQFVATLHHELIHRYLDDNFGTAFDASALLTKKYVAESDTVKSHLHLMAIQKAVYLKLRKNDELSDIIKNDSSIPNPGYKRSWEIVNTDGYQQFLDELR